MRQFNTTNFLFHVPGAINIYDTEKKEFVYENNWLTVEQVKAMPEQLRPEKITVAQCEGQHQRKKLGEMNTKTALEKFAS